MRSQPLKIRVLSHRFMSVPMLAVWCCFVLVMPSVVVGDTSTGSDVANIPAAFALYKEKAEQGDVEAQFNIGVMCETGWSVPVDNKKAVRWYREAAKEGHVDAQLRLGMLYYLGIGAPQSEIKGQKWIREAAKQNHVLASQIHKKIFSGDAPDALVPASAVKRVREVYLNNEKQALLALDQIINAAKRQDAREEKEKKDNTMRERRVQRLTEGPAKPGFSSRDEVERIKSVVPGFIGDASLEENRTLARGSVATIRLQAEKGLASAQYNLGRMYELGIKLPIDKRQAITWYQKSAEQAFADAEYRLGIALLYGIGVNRDEVQGKRWLSSAAGHNHAVAKKMVEGMRSELGSANISMAAIWYIERALAGDAESSYHLGKLYQHGWGVELNSGEAIKWYKRASGLGFEEAGAQLRKLMLKEKSKPAPISKKNELQMALEKLSLPAWLAHPGVIIFVVLVMLWMLFFRKGFRSDKTKKEEIQEV